MTNVIKLTPDEIAEICRKQQELTPEVIQLQIQRRRDLFAAEQRRLYPNAIKIPLVDVNTKIDVESEAFKRCEIPLSDADIKRLEEAINKTRGE